MGAVHAAPGVCTVAHIHVWEGMMDKKDVRALGGLLVMGVLLLVGAALCGLALRVFLIVSGLSGI